MMSCLRRIVNDSLKVGACWCVNATTININNSVGEIQWVIFDETIFYIVYLRVIKISIE